MLMYIELHKAQYIVEIKYQINITIKNLIRKIVLFIEDITCDSQIANDIALIATCNFFKNVAYIILLNKFKIYFKFK
jgi:hypothetical protein